MASTITPSTVTITTTVEHTLPDGTTRTWNKVTTISNVKYCDSRTMEVGTASMSILQAVAPGVALGPGKFTDSKVAALLIFSKDDTNFLTVGFVNTGAETVWHKCSTSMILLFPSLAFDVDAAGGAFGAFVFPDDIVAFSNTLAQDIEILVIQTT